MKTSITDHTLDKYDMLFGTYIDLLPLNLVYVVLENGNFVLENNIFLAVGTMIRIPGHVIRNVKNGHRLIIKFWSN